jgi:NADPH-dependent ferric siderophore reductase
LLAQVTGVSSPTPLLKRVHLTCPALAGREFPPASWVRGFFPDLSAAADAGPGDRPDAASALSPSHGGNVSEVAGRVPRAYTITEWDPAGSFALDFVLHGRGPAATWAQNAAVGEELPLAGPLGRTDLGEHRNYVFAGDTTALPAIRELLLALGSRGTPVRTRVNLWVPGPTEHQELPAQTRPEICWFGPSDPTLDEAAENGSLLADVDLTDPALKVWMAGEAETISRARRALTRHGLPPTQLAAAGYWR